MSPTETLPRWRCHKVVRAAPMLTARLEIDSNEHAFVQVVVDGTLHKITVPPGLFARSGERPPRPGDYLVEYENADGTFWKSWSPKATFEAGYARL